MCGRELVTGERKLCLHCEADLPTWSSSLDELRAQRFPRSAPIKGVWPWLVYTHDSPSSQLIRRGKFNDRPDIIEELARRYGVRLMTMQALAGVDALVPIPMHWWKRLRRGYNQAEIIADKISEESGIPVIRLLKAKRSHSMQSRKSGNERQANVAGIFELRAVDFPASGHIALVDDILTTGATLSEAIKTLSELKPASITILSLAATPIK